MLTDAHKEFIRHIRKKMFIHNNSPIYIDSLAGQKFKMPTSDVQNMIDRWILPSKNLAFISDKFCVVTNKIDSDTFSYIALYRETYQYADGTLQKYYGKVTLTGDVSNPFTYTISVNLRGKDKNSRGRRTFAGVNSASGPTVKGGSIDTINRALLCLFYYFGMTIIDHEYIDVEDQAEIHYTPSDNKPPVKVRYIKKVLRRYVNGPKTVRGPLTTGYEVGPKTRTYRHPRFVNMRGRTVTTRGYHVGPPTDNRPIEYRRKEKQ